MVKGFREGALRNQRPTGFTLLELLVVVALVMVLAASLAPAMMTQADKTNIVSSIHGLSQIALGMQRYRTDTGFWPKGAGNWTPSNESGVASAFTTGDTALEAIPAGQASCGTSNFNACWNGPYINNTQPNMAGQKDYLGNVINVAYVVVNTNCPASSANGNDAMSEGMSGLCLNGGGAGTGGIYVAPRRGSGNGFIPAAAVPAQLVAGSTQ